MPPALELTKLPRRMRVGVLRRPGEYAVEERPVPVPQVGEVLVQVGSVGVCGSDVHYFRHGRIAHHVVRSPLVLGHEVGGRIVALGAGVDSSRLGQRVAIEPGVPCRRCRQCKAGTYNLCQQMAFYATPPVDGAFAEYVIIAEDFAHPVPDSLSDDAAGLIEPLSVAVSACDKAAVGPGGKVLITGGGPIGLMNAQVARVRGATEVVLSDIVPARLEAARRFGATQVVDGSEAELDRLLSDADVFIDCSGSATAIRQGMKCLRPGGRIVLVGMGEDELLLPISVVQIRELVLTGTCRYANTYPTAIALAASGAVDLDAMVTQHFTLATGEEALNQQSDPSTIKVVVLPGRN